MLARAMKGMQLAQQSWVSKAAAHFLPNGQNMKMEIMQPGHLFRMQFTNTYSDAKLWQ